MEIQLPQRLEGPVVIIEEDYQSIYSALRKAISNEDIVTVEHIYYKVTDLDARDASINPYEAARIEAWRHLVTYDPAWQYAKNINYYGDPTNETADRLKAEADELFEYPQRQIPLDQQVFTEEVIEKSQNFL